MNGLVKGDLLNAALCWRLERQDGVAIGFTAHDRDLWIDGMRYRAAPGMLPSKISRSDGLDAELLDVAGALTSGAIRGDDLAAGRWDGARVTMFLTNWEEPGAEVLALASGRLGEVRVEGEAFEAELRGDIADLDRPVAEQTSPECRAELGDRTCRVDMRGRRRFVRVVSAQDEHVRVDNTDVGQQFAWGSLRWLSGANSGLSGMIVAAADGVLTLRDPLAFDALPGDLMELREGCDKAFGTCTARFGNGVNFRGEPHLPGMDLLTRYTVG